MALPHLIGAAVMAGVDPWVMAAQCAWETGWGHFGGAIDGSWNNTCGLKVRNSTGDRPQDHARFPSLAVGALAHAHHLSLYAGKDVPASTPDPRAVWLRPGSERFGTARTVQDLGGKWAPDSQYGHKVAEIVRQLQKGDAQ